MGKTVWLINQYASTPETGTAGRGYYLSRELARRGINTVLINGSFHHLLTNPPRVRKDTLSSAGPDWAIATLRTPVYSGAHSKVRVLSWFLFAFKLLKVANLIGAKPDVIVVSSPAPIAFLGARYLSRKFGARLVFEIRDLWPLTLVELGGYSARHPFIRFLQWIEDTAYRESDRVISTLPNALAHMTTRGLKPEKFAFVPNGVSIDTPEEHRALSGAAKSQIPKGKFLVGYAGTIGLANAIDVLIEAANILRDRPDILFVIVGKGSKKGKLQRRVRELGLETVTFLDPVPKNQVNDLLSRFDLLCFGAKPTRLYEYGISFNKIPEYLYAGKPIVSYIDAGRNPIDEARAGITVAPEDPEALADAISRCAEMPPEERAALGRNGREYAVANLAYGPLAERYARVLFDD